MSVGKIFTGGIDMARPKKANTEQLLQLLNTYYEIDGNPEKLKFSMLEKYAKTMGYEIKAYDFSRDKAVKARMEELKQTVRIGGTGVVAYKTMDINALIDKCKTITELKETLRQIDESWESVYEYAVETGKSNRKLLKDISAMKKRTNEQIVTLEQLQLEIKALKNQNRKIIFENRYLKTIIRKYLNDGIAEHILAENNEIKEPRLIVSDEAREDFMDTDKPLPFSHAIKNDINILSQEERIIKEMEQLLNE